MKLNLKDIQKYLFPIKRIFSKYRQIRSLDQVKNFIQEQSAQVSQMTLYGYLKTRMGAKHVIMFENKNFLNSINIAKWNIYTVALADCAFYVFSYLISEKNLKQNDCKEIFLNILESEKQNGLSEEIYNNGKKNFLKRIEQVDFKKYYLSDPFKESGEALYYWSPIADELKSLDKKIVLNSISLKWGLAINEFKKLTKNLNFN